MRVVGIDPGMTGALALLVDGVLINVTDMPVVDGEVNGVALNSIIGLAEPDIVVIEHVQPMPKNGSIASFSLGKNYGLALGVCHAMRYPVAKMRPMEWKRLSGLIKKPKEASRRLAMDLWPDHAERFSRVKDDGRAEAALIARSYAMKMVQAANV